MLICFVLSSLTLSPALRVPRWLCNEQIDAGTRRWAVEGLAYLTFDADVKEEFVEDGAALKALFQLSRVAPGFLLSPRGPCPRKEGGYFVGVGISRVRKGDFSGGTEDGGWGSLSPGAGEVQGSGLPVPACPAECPSALAV